MKDKFKYWTDYNFSYEFQTNQILLLFAHKKIRIDKTKDHKYLLQEKNYEISIVVYRIFDQCSMNNQRKDKKTNVLSVDRYSLKWTL